MLNRNIPMSLNAPLSERLRYAPDTVDLEVVAETLGHYEAILDAINESDLNLGLDVTDDVSVVVKDIGTALDSWQRDLIEDCTGNPYKEFFDDCVGALNGYWPGAAIGDETLRKVILDAITKGDVKDE